MAHRSILTPLTNQLVPLWLHSLPLQSSLSSSLLSLLSAPSSTSSATTAAHGLDSASSARIYDCTAALVGSSSSFGGATNPGCWAAGRSPPTGSPGGPTWCGSASPCGCGAAGRYWRTRLWVASAASSDIIPAGHAAPPRRGRPARRLRSKHGAAGRSDMFELGLTEVRQASAGTNWWPLYRNARRLYSC